MKLTAQQALVLFDLAKCALNQTGGFAGYSNEELMKLVNDIIAQQDNEQYLTLIQHNPTPHPLGTVLKPQQAENLAREEKTMAEEFDDDFWTP